MAVGQARTTRSRRRWPKTWTAWNPIRRRCGPEPMTLCSMATKLPGDPSASTRGIFSRVSSVPLASPTKTPTASSASCWKPSATDRLRMVESPPAWTGWRCFCVAPILCATSLPSQRRKKVLIYVPTLRRRFTDASAGEVRDRSRRTRALPRWFLRHWTLPVL